LGPFYGAIAVPSVTRCRRRRGHRCASMSTTTTTTTPGEWACGGSQWRMGPTFFKCFLLNHVPTVKSALEIQVRLHDDHHRRFFLFAKSSWNKKNSEKFHQVELFIKLTIWRCRTQMKKPCTSETSRIDEFIKRHKPEVISSQPTGPDVDQIFAIFWLRIYQLAYVVDHYG